MEGAAEIAAGAFEAGVGGGEGQAGELHEDGHFDVAALAKELPSALGGAAGGGGDDAVGAVDELGVGGLEVDHEVAEDGAGADHDGGGEHVEDELGGGAGFEARGAGEDLGAGDGGDGEVGDGGHLRVRNAGEGDGEGADLFGALEGAEDVGSAAAGGDADDRVVCVEGGGDGKEIADAFFGAVFGVLAREAEGGIAAGDEALHEGGGDGEGGGALAGVEDAEAAAGAGTHIKDAAAAGHALRDAVDGVGDGGELGADGLGDSRVFVVDEAKHVEGGELVEVGGVGVAGFGGERGEGGDVEGVGGHG